jgi:nicotinate-nucleotide adenylyltransferase
MGLTGLLGGAFDPPHDGHLALARGAREHIGLARVVVVATREAPHKRGENPAQVRFRLAEAAFAGMERVELSRHELDLGEPAYTVDTARWAADRWGEVVVLVGTDQLAAFRSWRDPEGVLAAARLGVATRPGFPCEAPDTVRPERIECFEIEPLPLSSSEIRARVRAGEPIDDLVPARVAALVRELGLYR